MDESGDDGVGDDGDDEDDDDDNCSHLTSGFWVQKGRPSAQQCQTILFFFL